MGATPQWSPNDKVTVRALFDWQETRDATTFPLFFTAGDFLPPPIPRGYLGQNWAQGRSLTENLGALVTAQLSREWSLGAGLFRSTADNPLSFADLYTDIQPNGQLRASGCGVPGSKRLFHLRRGAPERSLQGRDWHHELIFLARGRDVLARYGGEDAVDVGPAIIGTQPSGARAGLRLFGAYQSIAPSFGASVRRTTSIGASLVELEMGLQEENYRKDVTSPGTPEAELTDHPLRAYGNSAFALTRRLTLYAGYTQGLEDSGVAPSSAENRGAVLPASLTWQVDSGCAMP